ncbi:A/G-specific adenine glycosylase [Nitratireductor alexandrii]|uniref:A/G-specific adenine glycosylase n=1 Tax=Nitratireductor alexandrii TaxID=2448161 RepID=UPI000FDC6671|nr:A/G-specific adenine glycosylase [Nitratireductor alexandrii]
MTAPAKPEPNRTDFAARLMAWYDRHHRRLPWRVAPGERANGLRATPYRVWLSEIMLQQTTVAAVKPYYERFLRDWPDVEALAAAEREAVMKAWAGLGYYSRARNLKKCAEEVVARHDGAFPADVAALRALPGIGAYTSAAVAAIAFDIPVAVVDGNVERVVTRHAAIEAPVATVKKDIAAIVERWLPAERPGDFAQAMMDLGATICTPRAPACALCPVSADCAAFAAGEAERYPVKPAKAAKPVRTGAAFVAERADGALLLRKRGETGLLAGMSEVPTSAWSARTDGAGGLEAAPFAAGWRTAGEIRHVFTHFELRLSVYHARFDDDAPAGHWWSPRHLVHGEALPTVMKKAIEAAIPGATRKPPAPGASP